MRLRSSASSQRARAEHGKHVHSGSGRKGGGRLAGMAELLLLAGSSRRPRKRRRQVPDLFCLFRRLRFLGRLRSDNYRRQESSLGVSLVLWRPLGRRTGSRRLLRLFRRRLVAFSGRFQVVWLLRFARYGPSHVALH